MRNPIEVAQYFLREYWNGNLPVNLEEIADLNKVKVKYKDISNF